MKRSRFLALGLLVGCFSLEYSQAQTLSTVAGGAYGENRTATEAALYSPRRLARGPLGDVFIADAAAQRGYRRDPLGVMHLVAGNGLTTGVLDGPGGDPRDDLGDGGPAADATFNTISGLAVDSQGRLYIADTFNHRVRRVETNGDISTVAGTGEPGYNGEGVASASAQLNRPRGISIRSNRLFIADSANHRIRLATEDGQLYNFAGNGTPGNSGNNGPAKNAQLNLPSDLAFDSFGNAFIADTNNNVIRRVDSGGIIRFTMGGGNQADGAAPTTVKLIGPTAVDVDTTDNSLFVADTGQQRIRRLSGGVVKTVAGTGVAGYAGDGFFATEALINFPQDVVVMPDRSYLIADTENRRVRRVAEDPFFHLGVMRTYAGEGDTGVGAGDGDSALEAILAQPAGIAGRPGGGFYLSDTKHHRVRVVSSTGVLSAFAGTGQPGLSGEQLPALTAMLAGPTGLAVDGGGRLFIADTLNHRVRLVGAGGKIRTFAGSTRGNSGENVDAKTAQLDTPLGIATDATGGLYIADSANHKVRYVTPNGIITRFAGSGTAGSAGVGGPRLAVQLSSPAGVAVGPDGQVYIADTGNHRVLRIDNAGIVHLAAALSGGAEYVIELDAPTGVALNAEGDLFIADSGSGNMVAIGDRRPFMRALPLAGNGLPTYNGEVHTDPLDAGLAAPFAVALDAAGGLLITDTGNQRVRRLAIDYPAGDVDGDRRVDYADLLLLSTLLEQSAILAAPFSLLDRANLEPDAVIDTGDLAQFRGAFQARQK